MNVASFIVKTSLLFIVLIVVLNVISVIVGFKTNPNVDIVVLLILIRQYGTTFGITNNMTIEGKLFWKLYLTFSGVYLIYKLLLIAFASSLIQLNMNQVFIQFSIDIMMTLIFIPLSLALTNRSIKKQLNATKQPSIISSVTDTAIAEDIIRYLKGKGIEAFIDSTTLHGDPIMGSTPQNNVNILLHNPDDDQRASELVENYYKEIENKKPWTCSSCGEENEGAFEVCWKCGAECQR